VRTQADAAGLEEAKRGYELPEGLDRTSAGVRRVGALGAVANAGDGEEGGLPPGGAGALGGACFGGNLDGVGTHQSGGGQLEPLDRHL
jgi:hypothetical protein